MNSVTLLIFHMKYSYSLRLTFDDDECVFLSKIKWKYKSNGQKRN